MKKINSKTIVFVTGAFVSNSGWNEWRTYFESKEYTTIAPPGLLKMLADYILEWLSRN